MFGKFYRGLGNIIEDGLKSVSAGSEIVIGRHQVEACWLQETGVGMNDMNFPELFF